MRAEDQTWKLQPGKKKYIGVCEYQAILRVAKPYRWRGASSQRLSRCGQDALQLLLLLSHLILLQRPLSTTPIPCKREEFLIAYAIIAKVTLQQCTAKTRLIRHLNGHTGLIFSFVLGRAYNTSKQAASHLSQMPTKNFQRYQNGPSPMNTASCRGPKREGRVRGMSPSNTFGTSALLAAAAKRSIPGRGAPIPRGIK